MFHSVARPDLPQTCGTSLYFQHAVNITWLCKSKSKKIRLRDHIKKQKKKHQTEARNLSSFLQIDVLEAECRSVHD